MRDLPRILTGFFLILLGTFLCFFPFLVNNGYGLLILGIPCYIVGIVILVNKKEKKTEQAGKK